jgi:predicted nucleic acid-binding protein
MVIVDTSVWIDYLGGIETLQSVWLNQEVDSGRVGVADLVLYEVLQGCRSDREFRVVRERLLTLPLHNIGGEELATHAAGNYRKLRARGITVKTVDCLIASFCIRSGHMLLHRDSDFDFFERHLGLQVLRPSFH